MMFRIPLILRKGRFGKRACVSAERRLATSPMISNRRSTASCFSADAMKLSCVTPRRYLPMAFAESSMSRSSPNCLSSDIESQGRGEDLAAPVGIAAVLHGGAADKIDRAAEALLQIFLQATHFQKPHARTGQKLDQQVDVAALVRLPARERAEKFHPRNGVTLTDRTDGTF